MRIENLRTDQFSDRRRVVVDVAWEDCGRTTQEVYFETIAPFAEDLAPSVDAFLLASMPIATWLGERRILVQGSVCPRLRDGLQAVAAVFASWHDRCRPVEIEPTAGVRPPVPRASRRVASFLSGGIDALALLRANRLEYPPEHPASIRDCLLLFGLNSFDFGDATPRPERLAAYETHVQRMRQLGRLADFTLVPVYTNARTLYPDFASWSTIGFGAATTAAALALARRVSEAWLGSDGLGLASPPLGSHALLLHHFSTAAVEIHLGHVNTTRLEKTRLVADWEGALPFLRSCLYLEVPPDGLVNCGRCEKCVRTRLALVALGKLDRATSFPLGELTPGMLAVVELTPRNAPFYQECLEPLERLGRHDLVAPLRALLTTYHRLERWKREFVRLNRFDERFLKGRLARWYSSRSTPRLE